MWRERALKIVLIAVALFFTAAIYPMIGGALHPAGSDTGDTMMMSLYFTLGVFLLISVRNPSAHRSLIAFAAWSCFAHAERALVISQRDSTRRASPSDDSTCFTASSVASTLAPLARNTWMPTAGLPFW